MNATFKQTLDRTNWQIVKRLSIPFLATLSVCLLQNRVDAAACVPNQLYGVAYRSFTGNSATNGPSNDLRIVDITDGTSTSVATLLFSTFAIARQASTGRVYYIEAQPVGAPQINPRVAYWEPPSSAFPSGRNVQLPNPTGTTVAFIKLAQAADGTLYSIVVNGANSDLYTIDPVSGIATLVGNIPGLPVGSGDIAFDPNNVNNLFVTVTDNLNRIRLYTIDVNTRAIGINGLPSNLPTGNVSSASLAFGPDGELYTTNREPFNSPNAPDILYKIDKATGIATQIPSAIPFRFTDFATLPAPTPTIRLRINKDRSQQTVTAGGPITYNISLTNQPNSDCDFEGVFTDDSLPVQILSSTWTSSVAGTGSITPSTGTTDQSNPPTSNTINTTVGLAVGSTANYVVNGIIDPFASGTLTNTACATLPDGLNLPAGTPTVGRPGRICDDDTATIVPSADVITTKAGSTGAPIGGQVTYTITTTNNGPSPATNVIITDRVAPNAVFVSASDSGTFANGVVTWSVPSIAPGAFVTRTITVTVPAQNSYTNTASNTSDTSDPTPGNNDGSQPNASVTTVVPASPTADVTIVKTGTIRVIPGSNISYTLTVSNAGAADATNVQVQDTTPPGLTFVSNSGDCTTAFPCNLGTLPIGQTRTITTTFSIPVGYTVPNPIPNTATVTASNDGNPNNNTSGFNAFIPGLPITIPSGSSGLRLVKRVTNITRNGVPLTGLNFSSFVDDPNDSNDTAAGWSRLSPVGIFSLGQANSLQSGDEVEYTVYFLSDGSSPVNNVKVCDAIPVGTAFIPDSFSPGQGISLRRGQNDSLLTNILDADAGNFASPLAPVTPPCSDTTNANGSVFLQLGDVAPDTVGFVRFRVRIN